MRLFSSKRNWVILLILAITVVMVQIICNVDSYLYNQLAQYDSAVFFMCGKALMNGMIPYVDFTDSKGILLWLIYGIGYLIDHYSYIGIFWIMCGVLFLTLCVSYCTARLYLNRQASLLSALMLLIPLMYWNFYFETKAEHFCWPAVAWGIFVLMKSLKGFSIQWHDYVWIGVGIITCAMIKWNVAVMMLCFLISLCWISWQNGTLKHCLLNCAFGIIIAFLPFALYFTYVGNWQDMWQEYFVNTFATVTTEDTSLVKSLSVFFYGWKQLFATKMFLYLFYTLPVLVIWQKERWFSTILPALCGLFFIALSARPESGVHYITVAGPFAIMTIVVILHFFQKKNIDVKYLWGVWILGMIYVLWGSVYYSNYFFTKDRQCFSKAMALSATMSQVAEHPTVIILGMEPGLCMGTALPGTRYWTLQKGRTEQMWQEEWRAIETGSSDFIVLWWGADPKVYDSKLKALGYHYLSDYFAGSVYTKHDISMPQQIIDIPMKDIITKRTYKDIYEKSFNTHSMLQ